MALLDLIRRCRNSFTTGEGFLAETCQCDTDTVRYFLDKSCLGTTSQANSDVTPCVTVRDISGCNAAVLT